MADPVDPNAEAPPIPPTATMTLDQWAETDPEIAAKVPAFRAMFGPGADQLMDRGTLDLRLQTLEEATASPAEPPPEAPAEPPAE